MISYDPLTRKLAEKGLSRTELAKMIDISSVTLAKLGKNESVNLTVIDKICVALNCSIEEVVRIIPESKADYFANLEPTQVVRAKIPGIRYTTFVIAQVVKLSDNTYYSVRPIVKTRPDIKKSATPVTYAEMDAVIDEAPTTAFILNGSNTEFELSSSQILCVCGVVNYIGNDLWLAVMAPEDREKFYDTSGTGTPLSEEDLEEYSQYHS